MAKNKVFALVTRAATTILAVVGILLPDVFSEGAVKLLYYTYQSNIIIAAFFIYTTVRTLISLVKSGVRGSVSYSPRLQMTLTLTIFFTFLVFWAALAPFSGVAKLPLMSFSNLCVHAIVPLLAVFDYFFFAERGVLKKRDIALCAIPPCVYIALTYILGFCGVVYYSLDGVDHTCPYFFMDFGYVGFLAPVFILLIGAVFVGIAALLYRIDRRYVQKSARTDSSAAPVTAAMPAPALKAAAAFEAAAELTPAAAPECSAPAVPSVTATAPLAPAP